MKDTHQLTDNLKIQIPKGVDSKNRFLPSTYSIIQNITGLLLAFVAYNSARLALSIFIDPLKRITELESGILLILIFIVSGPPAYFFLFKSAAKILTVDKRGITITSVLFFRSKHIAWNDLKFVEVENRTTLITSLLGPNYKIVALSLDVRIILSTRHFMKRKTLFNIFTPLELSFDDIFIKFFFFRGRGSTLGRLLTDPAGIFSFVVILVLIFLYLWGAMAQFVNPAEGLQIKPIEALGLKNPNYQYAFDQTYGTFAVNQPAIDLSHLSWDTIVNPPFFLLGSDFVGRDYFSRLIYSTYFSLNIAIGFALASTLLGTILGSIFGFVGGKTDQVFLTISDIAIAVPPFVLWIIGASFTFEIRKSIGGVFIQIFSFMLIFMWSSPARLIRSEVMNLKKQEYIEAERLYGASRVRLLFRHIFPNLKPLISTIFITQVIELLMAMITVSIIIGAEGDLIWGSDISRRFSPDYYPQTLGDRYVIYSIVFFTIFIFGLLIFAETLKDALDPRFSKKKANKKQLRKERTNIQAKTKRVATHSKDKFDKIINRDIDNIINSELDPLTEFFEGKTKFAEKSKNIKEQVVATNFELSMDDRMGQKAVEEPIIHEDSTSHPRTRLEGTNISTAKGASDLSKSEITDHSGESLSTSSYQNTVGDKKSNTSGVSLDSENELITRSEMEITSSDNELDATVEETEEYTHENNLVDNLETQDTMTGEMANSQIVDEDAETIDKISVDNQQIDDAFVEESGSDNQEESEQNNTEDASE